MLLRHRIVVLVEAQLRCLSVLVPVLTYAIYRLKHCLRLPCIKVHIVWQFSGSSEVFLDLIEWNLLAERLAVSRFVEERLSICEIV